MRVVRSPVAHGRLKSIDAKAALALPGVHAVWTHADIADIPPIGFRLTGLVELEAYRQTALAQRYVRYVGEPVAAVFAADPYIAEDAADLVEIDIEPLPVVLDAAGPLGPFDEHHDTETSVIEKNPATSMQLFARPKMVVALDLEIGRHSGVPMETRGAIARYDEATTFWKCMAPRRCRTGTGPAGAHAWPPAGKVQLYEGHVGGGFGIRGEMYPEDVLVCAAALKFQSRLNGSRTGANI